MINRERVVVPLFRHVRAHKIQGENLQAIADQVFKDQGGGIGGSLARMKIYNEAKRHNGLHSKLDKCMGALKKAQQELADEQAKPQPNPKKIGALGKNVGLYEQAQDQALQNLKLNVPTLNSLHMDFNNEELFPDF